MESKLILNNEVMSTEATATSQFERDAINALANPSHFQDQHQSVAEAHTAQEGLTSCQDSEPLVEIKVLDTPEYGELLLNLIGILLQENTQGLRIEVKLNDNEAYNAMCPVMDYARDLIETASAMDEFTVERKKITKVTTTTEETTSYHPADGGVVPAPYQDANQRQLGASGQNYGQQFNDGRNLAAQTPFGQQVPVPNHTSPYPGPAELPQQREERNLGGSGNPQAYERIRRDRELMEQRGQIQNGMPNQDLANNAQQSFFQNSVFPGLLNMQEFNRGLDQTNLANNQLAQNNFSTGAVPAPQGGQGFDTNALASLIQQSFGQQNAPQQPQIDRNGFNSLAQHSLDNQNVQQQHQQQPQIDTNALASLIQQNIANQYAPQQPPMQQQNPSQPPVDVNFVLSYLTQNPNLGGQAPVPQQTGPSAPAAQAPSISNVPFPIPPAVSTANGNTVVPQLEPDLLTSYYHQILENIHKQYQQPGPVNPIQTPVQPNSYVGASNSGQFPNPAQSSVSFTHSQEQNLRSSNPLNRDYPVQSPITTSGYPLSETPVAPTPAFGAQGINSSVPLPNPAGQTSTILNAQTLSTLIDAVPPPAFNLFSEKQENPPIFNAKTLLQAMSSQIGSNRPTIDGNPQGWQIVEEITTETTTTSHQIHPVQNLLGQNAVHVGISTAPQASSFTQQQQHHSTGQASTPAVVEPIIRRPSQPNSTLQTSHIVREGELGGQRGGAGMTTVQPGYNSTTTHGQSQNIIISQPAVNTNISQPVVQPVIISTSHQVPIVTQTITQQPQPISTHTITTLNNQTIGSSTTTTQQPLVRPSQTTQIIHSTFNYEQHPSLPVITNTTIPIELSQTHIVLNENVTTTQINGTTHTNVHPHPPVVVTQPTNTPLGPPLKSSIIKSTFVQQRESSIVYEPKIDVTPVSSVIILNQEQAEEYFHWKADRNHGTFEEFMDQLRHSRLNGPNLFTPRQSMAMHHQSVFKLDGPTPRPSDLQLFNTEVRTTMTNQVATSSTAIPITTLATPHNPQEQLRPLLASIPLATSTYIPSGQSVHSLASQSPTPQVPIVTQQQTGPARVPTLNVSAVTLSQHIDPAAITDSTKPIYTGQPQDALLQTKQTSHPQGIVLSGQRTLVSNNV
jgi:hypothetical protein